MARRTDREKRLDAFRRSYQKTKERRKEHKQRAADWAKRFFRGRRCPCGELRYLTLFFEEGPWIVYQGDFRENAYRLEACEKLAQEGVVLCSKCAKTRAEEIDSGRNSPDSKD